MGNIILLSILITLTLHHATQASGRGRKPELNSAQSSEKAAPEPDTYTAKRSKMDPIPPDDLVMGLDPDEDDAEPMDGDPTTPEAFVSAFVTTAQKDDKHAFIEHAIRHAFVFEEIISLDDVTELNENLDDLIEIYESEIADSMTKITSMNSTNPNLTLADILPIVGPMVVFLKEKHMTDEGTTPLNTADDYRQLLIKLAHQKDAKHILPHAFLYKHKFIIPVREDIFRFVASKKPLNIEPYMASLNHFILQVTRLPPGTDDSHFNQPILRLTQAVETQLMLQGHVLCLTENNFLRSYLEINDQWNLGQFVRISIHHNIFNESKKHPKKEATYIKHRQRFLQDALPYEQSLNGDAQSAYRKALQAIFRHRLTTDNMEHIKEQLKKLSSKLVSNMIVWNARNR